MDLITNYNKAESRVRFIIYAGCHVTAVKYGQYVHCLVYTSWTSYRSLIFNLSITSVYLFMRSQGLGSIYHTTPHHEHSSGKDAD